MNPLCKKVYLELKGPGYGDTIADKDRVVHALAPEFGEVEFSMTRFRTYYLMLRDFNWKLTVTLVRTTTAWEVVRLEAGDTTGRNFGYAADLGSTTVVMQLVDLNRGIVVAEESIFNHQIPYGDEILSRIFYVKDDEAHLREMQERTLLNFSELMERLRIASGIGPEDCGVLTIGGNTTMIHFLLGFDPWTIFYTPFEPAFNSCGFIPGRELGMAFDGLVYCFPSAANYLGGDIISGLLTTDLHRRQELALYMDIGTNGEMILGNDEFLIAAAGAAGPALEGGISKQGMRASAGAVDTVRILDRELTYTTIAGAKPLGICGSGIVDLLAEMLLEGWIDYSGAFVPGRADRIVIRAGEYAVVYARAEESATGQELLFTQSDIHKFMDTKAAANTMVAFLLETLEIGPQDIQRLYMAGAFGAHLDLESAITIGLYPDLPRERFVQVGNGSLVGASRLLLDADLVAAAEKIIREIVYLSLAEAKDFINKMYAAKFLPHTDFSLYPTVMEKLKKRRPAALKISDK